ncbi:MAG TPA: hypothetical protein VE684_05515 [Crenalkalicoccus sp.]|nr:hypothetical protein [Crenalkalicoccus sp.]
MLLGVHAAPPRAEGFCCEVCVRSPQLAPEAHGFFCQHASTEQAAPFAATQRPVALACIQENAPKPAWTTKLSRYQIAEEDRMISPATQLFLAQRMGAEIRSEEVGHTSAHGAGMRRRHDSEGRNRFGTALSKARRSRS